jgi:hypothetical protein
MSRRRLDVITALAVPNANVVNQTFPSRAWLRARRMRADRIGLQVWKHRVDHILYLGPCIRTAVRLDREPAFEAQLLR